ncbi:zinc knuckle domain protein [Penicillium capsulatum]|uniref:Zinc knuckle domain protein n=1 Tax=Penicillium capsulatum TaxID=69766 RepID=A0A9W9LCI8_9EURO|nr:zinc knuckle domain protein [Penicillium capsulatum]
MEGSTKRIVDGLLQKTIEGPGWTTKYEEKIKDRDLLYTTEYHVYYDHYPLGEGKESTTKVGVGFYPPKNQDEEQQEIMKRNLDAAKAEWKKTDTYKKFKESLDKLSEEVAVSKILGLGCGSLNAINPFSKEAETRNRKRSYIQTAIILTMQEDLKSGPTLILQDPIYGETESSFLTNTALKGITQVMNDPDGFDAIDNKTIIFNIGGYEAFWHCIDKGPTPAAIITESLDTTIGDKDMLKGQSDLLSKYGGYPREVNSPIRDGVIWNGQLHEVTILCREGRAKQYRKCRKFGHVQSFCPNQTKCGHCTDGHPTWECPSAQNELIPVNFLITFSVIPGFMTSGTGTRCTSRDRRYGHSRRCSRSPHLADYVRDPASDPELVFEPARLAFYLAKINYEHVIRFLREGRVDAAEPVARFVMRAGLLGQSREVDDAAMGMKTSDSKEAGPAGGSAEEPNHDTTRTEFKDRVTV